MTILVSVETVLLVLLIVLVAGLLRSHAELLRRVGAADGDSGRASAPPPTPRRKPGEAAPGLIGDTPTGDPVSLSFEGGAAGPTLLAFLSTGCSTCAGFWDEFDDQALPGGIRTVIVTKGSGREQPARVRELAPARVPVLMSSAAWGEYGVPGAPYFVLVDGSVQGEGVATTWSALSSLVGDAIADGRAGVDETLAAAGIGPDHPSLYPAGRRDP
ncbi:MAG TPA: hypothetical protein VGI87_11400 [Solirubrobacteraceae bacterium]|jgi:hypothetical protein